MLLLLALVVNVAVIIGGIIDIAMRAQNPKPKSDDDDDDDDRLGIPCA
jgi:hypothetical protein